MIAGAGGRAGRRMRHRPRLHARRGAGQAGDWDAAVGFYRQALQDDPDRPDYKIALERAMVAAAGDVRPSGRAQFEAAGQLEEALRAYRKAQEFEPSNRP